MSVINFIGGEKGGVGKSFFAKILISYHISKRKPFTLFECDDVNRDIFRAYQNNKHSDVIIKIEEVIFSKAEKELSLPNKLLYAAQESDVIVNLPAGVHKLVGEWFKIGRVQEQAEDTGAKLFLWYVCDGDVTNLRLFEESRTKIPIQHIFVKNMVRLDEDEWVSALNICNSYEGIHLDLSEIPVVKIEKLGYWEAQALSQNYLSFEEIQREDVRIERIGRIEKNTIKYFLRDALAEVERVITSGEYSSGGSLRRMTPKQEYEEKYRERYEDKVVRDEGSIAKLEKPKPAMEETGKGKDELPIGDYEGVRDEGSVAKLEKPKPAMEETGEGKDELPIGNRSGNKSKATGGKRSQESESLGESSSKGNESPKSRRGASSNKVDSSKNAENASLVMEDNKKKLDFVYSVKVIYNGEELCKEFPNEDDAIDYALKNKETMMKRLEMMNVTVEDFREAVKKHIILKRSKINT